MKKRDLLNESTLGKPVTSCAVIGLGRFGASLALRLNALGCAVQGVERDPLIARRLSPIIPCTILDAGDDDALRHLDIANFDAVVVAIGSNFESAVMITAALKRAGARHIICRAASETHGKILLRVGAQQIIEPQSEAGRLLASTLTATPALQQITFGPDHGLVCSEVTSDQAGQSLNRLHQIGRYAAVFLIRQGAEMMFSPSGETIVQAGDYVVMAGERLAHPAGR